jgi:hypothetical protein
MTTFEALREFFVEKKIEQILLDARSKFKTVGTYAVFDYGFSVIHADGSKSPAGAVLRQAHTRRPTDHQEELGNSFLPAKDGIEAEMTVRKYGITFSGEGNWRKDIEEALGPADALNVQGNYRHEIVDFGTVRIVSSFFRTLYHYGDFLYKQWGRKEPITNPGEAGFIQPDPKLALSVDEWGRPDNSELNLKEDQIGVFTRQLAQDFLKGKVTRSDINKAFDAKMESGPYPFARQYRNNSIVSQTFLCKDLF